MDTFSLYRRYPWLFLTLAAAVVVPYELLVLAIWGGEEPPSFGASSALWLADTTLVTPLVSALHIHAVADVREGTAPQLRSVVRRGLRVLPAVAVVSLAYWVAVTAGFFLLIAPGVYLTLRWFVAAQAAAVERGGIAAAFASSTQLVSENYWRVAGFAICVGVITSLPWVLILLAFDSTTAFSFLLGLPVQVFAWSFGALTTALLYFDLRDRLGERFELSGPTGSSPPATLAPRAYTDRDRPPGWYVDPQAPNRMRYWVHGDEPGWAKRTAKTPGKVRRAWDRRDPGAKPPGPGPS